MLIKPIYEGYYNVTLTVEDADKIGIDLSTAHPLDVATHALHKGTWFKVVRDQLKLDGCNANALFHVSKDKQRIVISIFKMTVQPSLDKMFATLKDADISLNTPILKILDFFNTRANEPHFFVKGFIGMSTDLTEDDIFDSVSTFILPQYLHELGYDTLDSYDEDDEDEGDEEDFLDDDEFFEEDVRELPPGSLPPEIEQDIIRELSERYDIGEDFNGTLQEFAKKFNINLRVIGVMPSSKPQVSNNYPVPRYPSPSNIVNRVITKDNPFNLETNKPFHIAIELGKDRDFENLLSFVKSAMAVLMDIEDYIGILPLYSYEGKYYMTFDGFSEEGIDIEPESFDNLLRFFKDLHAHMVEWGFTNYRKVSQPLLDEYYKEISPDFLSTVEDYFPN